MGSLFSFSLVVCLSVCLTFLPPLPIWIGQSLTFLVILCYVETKRQFWLYLLLIVLRIYAKVCRYGDFCGFTFLLIYVGFDILILIIKYQKFRVLHAPPSNFFGGQEGLSVPHSHSPSGPSKGPLSPTSLGLKISLPWYIRKF